MTKNMKLITKHTQAPAKNNTVVVVVVVVVLVEVEVVVVVVVVVYLIKLTEKHDKNHR